MIEAFVFLLFIELEPVGLLTVVRPTSLEPIFFRGEFLFIFPAESVLVIKVLGTDENSLGAKGWIFLKARSDFLSTWPLSRVTVCFVSGIGYPPRTLKSWLAFSSVHCLSIPITSSAEGIREWGSRYELIRFINKVALVSPAIRYRFLQVSVLSDIIRSPIMRSLF